MVVAIIVYILIGIVLLAISVVVERSVEKFITERH